ncbi:hypothetical protein B9Z55_011268 [Caenorhabditis nigoni]|uniref:Sdz-33 F-box domain-containing protein n=1 Tax=Caenorhabditis nigoni TaxID=1611254 RepID=A0A2G5UJC6_9PELO|nr:hypothetical protein B9Z55_011268 [Caenorhabditis nigoni]
MAKKRRAAFLSMLTYQFQNLVNQDGFGDMKKKFKTFIWSNQGKGIGEWVRHLCSIFRCEYYEASFDIGQIRFDMQSLWNAFPKLNRAVIKVGPNKIDIQSFQYVSRALLPLVENVELNLHENLSIEHIGMANLEELKIDCPGSPNFDDLSIWNVERCIIETERFSLRSLNRFFKLWKKGSNPKLKYLKVLGEAEEDRNVLMKGLQAEGAEKVESKWKYTIQNCYGIRASIRMHILTSLFNVKFTVLN